MDIRYFATALFALAILHTFSVSWFKRLAHRHPEGSKGENFFHLLGEVEAVMLIWAAVLFLLYAVFAGLHDAIHYIESCNFTEPKFVFVIMTISATKPVIDLVDGLIRRWSLVLTRFIPGDEAGAFLFSALTVGTLLGSFVTEPAAMTVTALVLRRQYYERDISRLVKYCILGVLFVNVSIGGAMTPFAAPPVLMVAGKWEWDFAYMFLNFGWKATLATHVNAALALMIYRRTQTRVVLLSDSDRHGTGAALMPTPWWATCVHVVALGLVVFFAHHADVFFGVFMVFLGFFTVTKEFQEDLRLKEGLLVGGFLAGLVTLGGLQSWWLESLLAKMDQVTLFLGATCLTAITDNAALTYLGSQLSGLSESMKQVLVAGAISGGGLTVIANAPNPAGYSILNPTFENGGAKGGISPLGLLLAALIPTLIAMICFWFLPNLY